MFAHFAVTFMTRLWATPTKKSKPVPNGKNFPKILLALFAEQTNPFSKKKKKKNKCYTPA